MNTDFFTKNERQRYAPTATIFLSSYPLGAKFSEMAPFSISFFKRFSNIFLKLIKKHPIFYFHKKLNISFL